MVNNYVCFGSDEAICPNDNLYRIIGLFDDDQDGTYNAKLIKYDYANSDLLGTNGAYRGTCIDYQCTDFSYYKGNTNSSTIESYFWIDDLESNWTTSELNTINLNTNYINYLNNIDSKWVDMIATTTWYLGGMNGDYTTKEFYGGERNNAGYGDISTTNGKIGLMYVSDYGYAANPENWLDTLRTYDGDLLNNWMYMGLNEWTIASMTMNIGLTQRPYIFYLTFNGGVFLVDIIEFVVRPTFYLKPEVRISGGTGTSSDPYRLEL